MYSIQLTWSKISINADAFYSISTDLFLSAVRGVTHMSLHLLNVTSTRGRGLGHDVGIIRRPGLS